MSNAHPPYHLRPNKSVDRELFLSLLSWLSAELKIERYQYIGLGGLFLEDFRLIHARLGINDLISVESNPHTHERQKFNRPVGRIKCIEDQLQSFITNNTFEKPVVIWFDYTSPKNLVDQIEGFSQTINVVPDKSVLRLTLNANPGLLGEQKSDEMALNLSLLEWRLKRLKKCLGKLYPFGLDSNDMTHQKFGLSLLKAVRIAVDSEKLTRKIIWALATHYSDGQYMITATIIVCEKEDRSTDKIETLVKDWEYLSTPDNPHQLNMPVLSARERLAMESCENLKEKENTDIPGLCLGKDQFESFKQFYRLFPHFSRVEL